MRFRMSHVIWNHLTTLRNDKSSHIINSIIFIQFYSIVQISQESVNNLWCTESKSCLTRGSRRKKIFLSVLFCLVLQKKYFFKSIKMDTECEGFFFVCLFVFSNCLHLFIDSNQSGIKLQNSWYVCWKNCC